MSTEYSVLSTQYSVVGNGPNVNQASVLSTQYFVVGIGLNVNQSREDFESLGLQEATSLGRLAGRGHDVGIVTRLLIQKLDAEYERLLNGQIAELEAQWTRRLALQGRSVTAELMDASELGGRLRSLSFDHLEIESTNGQVRRLRPEEVRHIRSRSS